MRGYSRDEKRGNLQIVYGLLCDRAGRPIAVEVFEGNTLDHQTALSQVEKLKKRFELSRVVFVSDRGMVTTGNLAALREAQIDWSQGVSLYRRRRADTAWPVASRYQTLPGRRRPVGFDQHAASCDGGTDVSRFPHRRGRRKLCPLQSCLGAARVATHAG
jgi:hypothetical protein